MKRVAMALVVCAAVVLSGSAGAWGPTSAQAVVTTAMHVLTKEGVVPLSRLDRDVRDGVAVPPAEVQRLYPAFDADKVRAIESEMNLLASVRGSVIDPYFAYRLGLLGGLVARVSAPLADDPSPFRQQYYDDVDRNIGQVSLKTSTRKRVDAMAYFERVRRLADARKELVLRDYQEGTGFRGVANASLAEDASRSVDAVADVWYTILAGGVVHASVSDAQLRDYVVNAMSYYAKRGNPGEIESMYARLSGLTAKTPDMARQLGDIFYGAGLYERAIEEYQVVLAAEPSRRDVVEKIAAYYMMKGQEAVDRKNLQGARDYYAKAAETDPLHPEAEAKRLEVERLMAERETRLETTRHVIEEAAGLETKAEQLAMARKHADAITVLKEAEQKYGSVTSEFPTEYQAATAGLSNVTMRLRQLKSELIQNAQTLSGAGFTGDLRKMAVAEGRTLDESALRALNQKLLNDELVRLKTSLQDATEFR